MKKLFLVLLLSFFATSTLWAQEDENRNREHGGFYLGADRDTLQYIIASPFDNWYIMFGAGGQTFIGNELEASARHNKLNYQFNAEVGKWLIPDVAVALHMKFFDVSGQSQYGKQPFIDKMNELPNENGYYPFHAHALSLGGLVTLDWTNLFSGYEKGLSKKLHIMMPLGLGGSMLMGLQKNPTTADYAVGDFRRNFELYFMGGLQFEYRCTEHVTLDLNASLMGSESTWDWSPYNNGHGIFDLMPSVTAAVKFNLLKTVTKVDAKTGRRIKAEVHHVFIPANNENIVILESQIDSLRDLMNNFADLDSIDRYGYYDGLTPEQALALLDRQKEREAQMDKLNAAADQDAKALDDLNKKIDDLTMQMVKEGKDNSAQIAALEAQRAELADKAAKSQKAADDLYAEADKDNRDQGIIPGYGVTPLEAARIAESIARRNKEAVNGYYDGLTPEQALALLERQKEREAQLDTLYVAAAADAKALADLDNQIEALNDQLAKGGKDNADLKNQIAALKAQRAALAEKAAKSQKAADDLYAEADKDNRDQGIIPGEGVTPLEAARIAESIARRNKGAVDGYYDGLTPEQALALLERQKEREAQIDTLYVTAAADAKALADLDGQIEALNNQLAKAGNDNADLKDQIAALKAQRAALAKKAAKSQKAADDLYAEADKDNRDQGIIPGEGVTPLEAARIAESIARRNQGVQFGYYDGLTPEEAAALVDRQKERETQMVVLNNQLAQDSKDLANLEKKLADLNKKLEKKGDDPALAAQIAELEAQRDALRNKVNEDRQDASKLHGEADQDNRKLGIRPGSGVTPLEAARLAESIAGRRSQMREITSQIDSLQGVLKEEMADPMSDLADAIDRLGLPMARVFYQLDKYDLDYSSRAILHDFALKVKRGPKNVKYYLIGAADAQTGSVPHNQWLSQKRCQAVYDVLTRSYGISPDQLEMYPLGGITEYSVQEHNRTCLIVLSNSEITRIIEKWTSKPTETKKK